ncbi:hypothetical protein EPUS_09414 [Endocarpon pusillum Z07020]|uniref:Uncharacterized protein n=1 Tax=Endocarpon pusillum (strain Z07020 / HMAS-L-300199) TaxID=1263415 RepID=U1G5Z5_ENDPU|nr:uncharacterized protein EPUS_09414 [Endocarpon pusillum Z07020]ERF72767.1 hypothetical protein EPUS_09414 [Endocarpon pusillum Z07020]
MVRTQARLNPSAKRGAQADGFQPSNSPIPRPLRPGPSSISPAPNPFGDPGRILPDEEKQHAELHSIINGNEHVNTSHRGGEEVVLSRNRTHRHVEALKAKSDAYVDYTNKTLTPEQTDFMIQQLEKQADPRLQRTYVNGLAIERVISSAPVLSVGLKFLRGADKAQVNRSEQIDMEGKIPDQKDALWRVDTAGSLLTQFNVSPDLQIVQTDQTASIVARAKNQAREPERIFPGQRRALASRKRPADTLTIDSERVTIVNDLRLGNWDLRGLLVEVDWSSLWDLMVNYRNLIAGGGPEMTFEETRTLLETMIEDARRLCIRSPILFRMATRVSIINSENTRYGINLGPMFKTLTTSKGIKEIISLSASYYNSLDPTGSDDSTQKYIRPRFLQMLVLLLSLLNNEDLAEMKDFLEATYKIKADRRDIELLILKVIPLLSINPRVFLNSLVPAIDGYPLPADSANTDEKHSDFWNIFVKNILEDGYLLPGTVDDLGRRSLSWIVKWPEDGFKSTTIFNHLQYAGRLRTINDIPPVEVHPGSKCTELTVVMTDDSKYIISPRDLDGIVNMTPGKYVVQATKGEKQCYDLLIQEKPLNDEIYKAIKQTNEIVHLVNYWLANPTKRRNAMINKILPKKSEPQPFLNEFRATGRLVEVLAFLNKSTLAVTYKLEGRKLSRIDAIQNLARDTRQLRAFIDRIEQRGSIIEFGFNNAEKRQFKNRFDQVRAEIELAEKSREMIGIDKELSNEPIVKCLYPAGVEMGGENVWNGYEARCTEQTGYLRVKAKYLTIHSVKWLTGEVIELSFDQHQQSPKTYVTPLRPVPEGYRDDEARVDDLAILLGNYIAIGKRNENSSVPNEDLTMINYLRIVSMQEHNQSRRGKNQMQESHSQVCSFK